MGKNSIDKILSMTNELRWKIGEDFHDHLAEGIYADASEIAESAVFKDAGKGRFRMDQKIDEIVTSKTWGFPIMFLLLGLILWLTIEGANYPSAMLANLLLDTVHPILKNWAAIMGMPWWLDGFLLDGVYLAVAWVIAVMLLCGRLLSVEKYCQVPFGER